MTIFYIFCDNFAKIKLFFLKYDEIVYSRLYLCIDDYIGLSVFRYPLFVCRTHRELERISFPKEILDIFASITGKRRW